MNDYQIGLTKLKNMMGQKIDQRVINRYAYLLSFHPEADFWEVAYHMEGSNWTDCGVVNV